MFCVTGILANGRCLMCDKESEVFEVEAPQQQVIGHLCAADFRKLVKLAAAQRPVRPKPQQTITPISPNDPSIEGR